MFQLIKGMPDCTDHVQNRDVCTTVKRPRGRFSMTCCKGKVKRVHVAASHIPDNTAFGIGCSGQLLYLF